jgi:hypothetical protein
MTDVGEVLGLMMNLNGEEQTSSGALQISRPYRCGACTISLAPPKFFARAGGSVHLERHLRRKSKELSPKH